jgi:cbb3-type cytochrome oxidase cytochrome c subunit
MSSVAQAMLRIYGHLDASSIEAARRVAEWARERKLSTDWYDEQVRVAEQRAQEEAERHAAGLLVMDRVGAE